MGLRMWIMQLQQGDVTAAAGAQVVDRASRPTTAAVRHNPYNIAQDL